MSHSSRRHGFHQTHLSEFHLLFHEALPTYPLSLNFFFLIVGVLRAARNENPLTAQLKARVFYILRTVAVLIALVIALKSARFDPVATLLPLCFMRIALFAAELMRKKKFRKEQA